MTARKPLRARSLTAFKSEPMAMRFCILGSGSSGNCALLTTDGARILVDVGFSARKTKALLASVGESLETIDAVFLTHEHGDHAAGIEGLKKFPAIKIFANAATRRAVQAGLEHTPEWQIFETGSRFRFRDLEVESFAVPHDAHEPVGFRFTHGHDEDLFSPRRSLAWLTDMGHAPTGIGDRIRECDVVVVESNHCPKMLEADHRRSWTTKQRISGRHGHLSNESARALLSSVSNPRWKRIYLTHLSRDCNSLAAVEAAFTGVRELFRCELSIVQHGEGTPFYEIS